MTTFHESDGSSLTRRHALTGLGAATAAGVAGTLFSSKTAEAAPTAPKPDPSLVSARYSSNAAFYTYGPVRLIDTRIEGGRMTRAQSRLATWLDTTDTRLGSIVANVTVVDTNNAGYMTFWAANAQRPEISDINWWGDHQILSNQIVIPLGNGGGSAASFRYYLFGASGVSAHVLVDVKGYYYNS
jgi:hypothetical protein